MGIRIEFCPRLLKLMDPADQAKFGPGLHPQDDAHPPPKTDKLERKEQASFANHCLLHDLPFVWHATHKPSKATPGTPDFWVGINRIGIWIEFKRVGADLSKDQKEFKRKLEVQGLVLYVVYSSGEGIALLQQFDSITL
jgi:hypothetical protein